MGQDNSGTGTELDGIRTAVQDEDASTVETFRVVLRSDAAGQPDSSAAGLLLQTTPIALPPGMGQQAWLIDVTFSTPSTVLPICGPSYYGLALTPAPTWPADGMSVHAGSYYLLGGTQGDNPAPNAPNLTWSIPGGTGGTPAQPPPMCLHIGLLVPSSVQMLGNFDPTLNSANNCITTQGQRSFGAGGTWPRLGGGRNDGLDVLVRDGNASNGLFATAIGASILCPGLHVPGLGGAFYLNPAGPFAILTSGPLDPTGQGTTTLLQPGTAPVAVLGATLYFQTVTIDPAFTQARFSNLTAVSYLP